MSNKWDVNYMRKIAGLPLLEWDTDTEEHRGEATESGIEFLLKKLNVRLPLTHEGAERVADKIEQMSNDTGYGSTISSDDVMDYLVSRHFVK